MKRVEPDININIMWCILKFYTCVCLQDSPLSIDTLHNKHVYNAKCYGGQRLAGGSIKKGNGDADLQNKDNDFFVK